MRYTITFLIFLLPVFSIAQSNKARTDSAVIKELVDTWSLGLKEDGDEPADIRIFNKYKSLFWPDALVVDDINAIYNPQFYNDPNPYKTKIKPVELYAHDMVLQFKNLKIDSVTVISDVAQSDTVRNITIARSISGVKRSNYIIGDLDSLVNNIIKYKTDKYYIDRVDTGDFKRVLQKTIVDRENLNYSFRLRDTLLITLVANKDAINKWDSIKIRSILNDPSLKIKKIRCKNDDDQDGQKYRNDQSTRHTRPLLGPYPERQSIDAFYFASLAPGQQFITSVFCVPGTSPQFHLAELVRLNVILRRRNLAQK